VFLDMPPEPALAPQGVFLDMPPEPALAPSDQSDPEPVDMDWFAQLDKDLSAYGG